MADFIKKNQDKIEAVVQIGICFLTFLLIISKELKTLHKNREKSRKIKQKRKRV